MYYEELENELNELINSNKMDEALIIIDNELSMPYIPNEFEQKLFQMKSKINQYLSEQSKSKNKTISLEEMTKILSNSSDPISQALAIREIKNLNIRHLMSSIKNFLIDEYVIPENKTFMLFALNEQQVSENFDVVKNNKKFIINPAEIKMNDIENKIDISRNIIFNSVGINNPTLAEIALNIAISYLFIIFPEEISTIEWNDIIAASIKQAHLSFGIQMDFEEIELILNFDINNAKLILDDFVRKNIGGNNNGN